MIYFTEEGKEDKSNLKESGKHENSQILPVKRNSTGKI